jgi:hypothetical protein
MPFVQIIVLLIVLGVAVWALNYLLAGYMEPWILALVNKLIVVLVVIMLLYFVLSLFGIAPPMHQIFP